LTTKKANYTKKAANFVHFAKRWWNWRSAVLVVGAAAALVLLSGHDPRGLRLLANTGRLAISSGLAGLAAAAVVALALSRGNLPGRRLVLFCLVVLASIPLTVQAAAWQAGFAGEGWLNPTTGTRWFLSGWPGAIFVHAAAGVPWASLILCLGFAQVVVAQEEMALLDYGPLGALWRVTLRGAAPAAAAATLAIAALAVSEITVTDIFQVRTYAEEIYTELAVEPQAGIPGTGAGLLLVGLLLAAAMFLGREITWRLPSVARRRPTLLRGGWKWALNLSALAILGILVALPLASLVWKAGAQVVQAEEGHLRSWSAAKAVRMTVSGLSANQREFGCSLLAASAAATVAWLVAVPLAWRARRRGLASAALAPLTLLLWFTPGPTIGILVINAFNQPGMPWLLALYDRSLAPVIVAQALRGLPLAILVAWVGVRQIPQGLLDLAAVEGMGRWEKFRHVIWPACWPALGLAWLTAFTVALAELPATLLARPPGVETLTTLIFSKLHTGNEDDVAGVCLAVISLSAVLAWPMCWLARRFATRCEW